MLDALNPFANWLLTYLLHSTALLGAAWLAARRLGDHPALEEKLWKGAFLVALGTATLAVCLPSPRWTVAPAPISLSAPVALSVGGGTVLPETVATSTVATSTVATSAAAPAMPWTVRLLAFAWIPAAGLTLLGLAMSVLALRRRLANRRVLEDGTARRLLDGLLDDAPGVDRRAVRLSASDRLAVPIAFGILRPEICLPTRAVDGLGRAELRAVLGHELAHLTRRDPLWRLLTRLAAGALLQPLHLLAARRLERLAEVLADDWAVDRTLGGATLARSLAEVAGWTLDRRRPALAVGMTDGANLEQRVRRLLDRDVDRRPAPRATFAVLVGVLLLGGLAAPRFDAAPLPQDSAPPEEVEVENIDPAWDTAAEQEWDEAEQEWDDEARRRDRDMAVEARERAHEQRERARAERERTREGRERARAEMERTREDRGRLREVLEAEREALHRVREEEHRLQSDELRAQEEALRTQAEELRTQAEELRSQADELREQALRRQEELQRRREQETELERERARQEAARREGEGEDS